MFVPSAECEEALGARFTAVALVTAAFAICLCGCPPCRPANEVFVAEDWEGCEVPCGWAVDGQVELVETHHPAEHALSMESGTSLTLELSAEVPAEAPLEIQLLASCGHEGLVPTLAWELASGEVEEQQLSFERACGGRVAETDLDARFTFFCADAAATRPEPSAGLTSLSIRSVGPCVVDHILLFTPDVSGGC